MSTRPLICTGARSTYGGRSGPSSSHFSQSSILSAAWPPNVFLATLLWVALLFAGWSAAGLGRRALRARTGIAVGVLAGFGMFVLYRCAATLVAAHAIKGFGQDGNGPYYLLGVFGLYVAARSVLRLVRLWSTAAWASGGERTA